MPVLIDRPPAGYVVPHDLRVLCDKIDKSRYYDRFVCRAKAEVEHMDHYTADMQRFRISTGTTVTYEVYAETDEGPFISKEGLSVYAAVDLLERLYLITQPETIPVVLARPIVPPPYRSMKIRKQEVVHAENKEDKARLSGNHRLARLCRANNPKGEKN